MIEILFMSLITFIVIVGMIVIVILGSGIMFSESPSSLLRKIRKQAEESTDVQELSELYSKVSKATRYAPNTLIARKTNEVACFIINKIHAIEES